MGYFGGPNKALTNPCFKRPKLVSFGKKQEKREGEEERRREEEEKEEIKPRSRGMDACLLYGNYFEYGFCMDHMEFKA